MSALKVTADNKGQAILETILGMTFLVLPTTLAVIAWFSYEWNKTKCAHDAFIRARNQLIQTRSFVHLEHHCGPITHYVDLSPLEDLDLNKGALGPVDAQIEVSRLSDAALRLRLLLPQ